MPTEEPAARPTTVGRPAHGPIKGASRVAGPFNEKTAQCSVACVRCVRRADVCRRTWCMDLWSRVGSIAVRVSIDRSTGPSSAAYLNGIVAGMLLLLLLR